MLLIDIGNTRIKWAYLNDQGQLCEPGVVSHADFNLELMRQLKRPNDVWISNVGSKALLKVVSDELTTQFGVAINVVTVSQSAGGLTNDYKDLEGLGVDRWVAAIGARAIVSQGDLIIIDAGSAVTIDWLRNDNSYQGGVILPGVWLMHESLVGQIDIGADLVDRGQIIGKNTEECVNSGVSYGVVGAVERVVDEMQHVISAPVTILLTGGDAPLIMAKSDLPVVDQPDLVLRGLAELVRERV